MVRAFCQRPASGLPPRFFLPEMGLPDEVCFCGRPLFCSATRGPGLVGPGVNGPGVNGPGVNGPGVNGPGVNGPGLTGRAAFGLIGKNPASGGLMHTLIKIAVVVVMLVFIAMGVNTVFL